MPPAPERCTERLLSRSFASEETPSYRGLTDELREIRAQSGSVIEAFQGVVVPAPALLGEGGAIAGAARHPVVDRIDVSALRVT
jgi:hypothetical protein